MKKRFSLLFGVIVVLFCVAAVPFVFAGGQKEHSSGALMRSDPTVSVRNTTQYGKILVGSGGKTLYVFQKDSPGKSNCTGGCAQLWPPLLATSGQTPSKGSQVRGTLATIKRAGGKDQVTYNGMPLYYYLPDTAPGQATGQGIPSFGGLWYVVPPKATSFAQAKSMSERASAQTTTTGTKPAKSWG